MTDLHLHTTASDGTDSPTEVLMRCKEKGIEFCSITDHDTVGGQAEALEAAKDLSLLYLTGVELSVSYSEGELHLLGYGIDYKNTELEKALEQLRQSRLSRAQRILQELKKNDAPLRLDDIEQYAGGDTIGRPHIAQAMIGKGYVHNMNEAFDKYLGEQGCCYVSRDKLSIGTAFKLIEQAGGVPVLAHPKYIHTNDFDTLVQRLTKKGLRGIEAYYPSHTNEKVDTFLRVANRYDLMVTTGSDYHGDIRPHADVGCEKRSSGKLKQSIRWLKDRYIAS